MLSTDIYDNVLLFIFFVSTLFPPKRGISLKRKRGITSTANNSWTGGYFRPGFVQGGRPGCTQFFDTPADPLFPLPLHNWLECEKLQDNMQIDFFWSDHNNNNNNNNNDNNKSRHSWAFHCYMIIPLMMTKQLQSTLFLLCKIRWWWEWIWKRNELINFSFAHKKRDQECYDRDYSTLTYSLFHRFRSRCQYDYFWDNFDHFYIERCF